MLTRWRPRQWRCSQPNVVSRVTRRCERRLRGGPSILAPGQSKTSEIESALRWVASNTLPVSRLDDLSMLRAVLDQIALKMDGKPAAVKVVSRKRAVPYNALDFAVERKRLGKNRIREVKWTASTQVQAIDSGDQS